MVRAARKKHSTRSPAVDPVVGLAKDLLVLWDADDGSEREYDELGTVAEPVKYDTTQQFAEWRDAVQKIITYTKPKSLQGALVQLVIACDTLSDIDSTLQAEDNKDKALARRLLQMDRILRSVIRVMGAVVGDEIDPSVRSLVGIYSGNDDWPLWTDRVNGWADKGRMLREREGR